MHGASANRRHFINVAILTVLGTILVGVLMKWALPMPPQASSQALIADRVLNVHVWLIAFFFSLVMVFMLYALFVFRRREGDDTEGDHFEGNTTLEIVWTVVPLVIVLYLGFLGVRTLNEMTAVQDNELVVQVEGFQWSWAFTYPDGTVSAELVLPVNRPALMEMSAVDKSGAGMAVLHSFWVPEFRVKQDLVPGQVTVLRFTPTQVGDYKVRCAELCGLSHWSMESPVRVVTEEEFASWMSEQVAGKNPVLAEANLELGNE